MNFFSDVLGNLADLVDDFLFETEAREKHLNFSGEQLEILLLFFPFRDRSMLESGVLRVERHIEGAATLEKPAKSQGVCFA